MIERTEDLILATGGKIALPLALTAVLFAGIQPAWSQQDSSEQVQEIYLAYYGRPGDPAGVEFWAGHLEAEAGNLSAIIDQFGTSIEYADRFGALADDALINNIYQQLFGRDADSTGLAFYLERLQSGAMTLPSIALDIANGVQTGSDDAAIVANKLNAALYFTSLVEQLEVNYGADQIDAAYNLLANVDSSWASLTGAIESAFPLVISFPSPTGPIVFFQSSFEDGVSVEETGVSRCSGDILGTDNSERGDWVSDLESNPLATTNMCYGGADDCALNRETNCQRGIALVNDPDQASNTVLHTWIKEPAENFNDKDADDVACSGADGLDQMGARKARAQLTVDADSPLASLTYSVRLRLGDAFDTINNDLGLPIDWMTIGEIWNQGPQTIEKGDRTRVTLNLIKETGAAAFHFGLKADYQPDGESGWTPLWSPETGEQLLSDVAAPIGEWFTLRVSLVAGDARSGQVTVIFVRDNGEEIGLFDVADATVYPNGVVQGFTAISPIKLYTAGNLVCWLKGRQPSLPLEAWWDDFSLSVAILY